MSTSILTPARAAYYDRNATSSYLSYDAAPGTHTNTTRWTVTVSAGKKLLIEQSVTQLTRTAAATTVGSCGAQIFYVGQLFQMSGSNSNTLGILDRLNLMTGVTLFTGEVMYSNTYDGSTGGTVYFTLNYKGTLFDA